MAFGSVDSTVAVAGVAVEALSLVAVLFSDVVVGDLWVLLASGLGGLLARREIFLNQPRTPDLVGEVGVAPDETWVVCVGVSVLFDGTVVIGGAILKGLLLVVGFGSSTFLLVVTGGSSVAEASVSGFGDGEMARAVEAWAESSVAVASVSVNPGVGGSSNVAAALSSAKTGLTTS